MVYRLTWAFATIIYIPIFYELYRSRWEKIDYTHAYFILPVSLYVVWQNRTALKELVSKAQLKASDNLGLIAMIIGLLMFVVGWRQDYLVVSSLSMIPFIWGISRYLYGSDFVKALTFPIFFLLFLIPPPLGILDSITMPMRYGISQVTEVLLHILGYPITRNGLMLTMGDNEIFMGAPCSGFRSLITMFALAVAYVHFIRASVLKRFILIPAVLPLALFGNLLRVMALCLITYYFGQEVAEGFFHYFSGAIIFLIMIIGLMLLEHFIDKHEKAKGRA